MAIVMYTRTDILYPMQAPDVGAVGGWCKFRIKQYKGVRETKREREKEGYSCLYFPEMTTQHGNLQFVQ